MYRERDVHHHHHHHHCRGRSPIERVIINSSTYALEIPDASNAAIRGGIESVCAAWGRARSLAHSLTPSLPHMREERGE